MNFIIVGASSGLGRALAEELAIAGHRLFLVASDVRDLQAVASSLSLKTGSVVDYFVSQISPRESWLTDFEKKIIEVGDLDGLFLPLGWSSDQDLACSDSDLVDKLVEINFTAIVKIIALCLPRLLVRNKGYIIGFGSVASLRGRSSNVIYSAAKRALISYFESLRHATVGTKIKVQLYQLGYLDTPRNFGQKLFFPKADPAETAKYIIKNLDRNFGFAFFPRFWFFIQYIIRWLPWWIFKRFKF